MSNQQGINRDILWGLGSLMDHWGKVRCVGFEGADADIGQVGILFRRYLETKYGIDKANTELQSAANLAQISEPYHPSDLNQPFGLYLVSPITFAPDAID
jgi:hypothetical protein